jgi:hypothetical protein
MKKKKFLKIVVTIGIIIFLLILSSFYGFLGILNQPINSIIAGNPNKKCNVDSDCVLRATTCSQCDCGDAVNRNWYTLCPFADKSVIFCKMCATPNSDFEVKCVNNTCQIVWGHD